MPYVNFMERRDLAKDHPNFILIDEQGQLSLSGWAQAHHIPNLHYTCLNSQAIHQWALEQVKAIMDMGYDGVFVDNYCPLLECHGHRLGKHKHDWPGKSNTEVYYELLGKIYQLVKSYGSDKAIQINSTINDDLWKYCDSQMDENIVYGGDSAERSGKWQRVWRRYFSEIAEPLMESIIEVDEEVMERYFEGQEPTEEELSKLMVRAVAEGSLIPVLCVSGKTGGGMSELLDALALCTLPPDQCKRTRRRR